MFKGSATKIFKLAGNRLFGSSGHYADLILVRDWLQSGGDKPTVNENFHGILVDGGKLFVLEAGLARIEYQRKFFAVGSGREYAMTAMYLEKTAAEAVAIAIKFATDSGGPIIALQLDE